jgi:hypothetical protein
MVIDFPPPLLYVETDFVDPPVDIGVVLREVDELELLEEAFPVVPLLPFPPLELEVVPPLFPPLELELVPPLLPPELAPPPFLGVIRPLCCSLAVRATDFLPRRMLKKGTNMVVDLTSS